MIEIISFCLVFNVIQFLLANTFSELFWAAHRFNRVHQNIHVSSKLCTYSSILNKSITHGILRPIFIKWSIRVKLKARKKRFQDRR